jgi:RHS repeat-associated protein
LNTTGTTITSGERILYLGDANYNVTAVVKQVSTGSGPQWQVVERYTYDPYGVVTVRDAGGTAFFINRTQGGIDNNLLYTGKQLSWNTLLQDNIGRYYDPRLQRFVNRDPAGYWGKDVNLYRYVHNSPTMAVDPHGTKLIVAGPNDTLGTTIGDFLGGGGPDNWFFPPNHPVSGRFAAHPALAWVWDFFNNDLDKYCCCNPNGSRVESVNAEYEATSSDFWNDIFTEWGFLTEGFPYNDFGVQVVGSFDYEVTTSIDCKAKTKAITIKVYNTWSIESLTHNPYTGEPLTTSTLLEPVSIEIVIYRSGTVNPKCGSGNGGQSGGNGASGSW